MSNYIESFGAALKSIFVPPAPSRTRSRGRRQSRSRPRSQPKKSRTPDVLKPQGAAKVTKTTKVTNGKKITQVQQTTPGGSIVEHTEITNGGLDINDSTDPFDTDLFDDSDTSLVDTDDDSLLGLQSKSPLPKEILDKALKKLPPPGTGKSEGPGKNSKLFQSQSATPGETDPTEQVDQGTEEEKSQLPQTDFSGVATTTKSPNKKIAKTKAELDAHVVNWTNEEIDLFNKLNTRGYYPLMPQTWQKDFTTIPLINFSTKPNDPTFLNSIKGDDFRATKALKDMFAIGARVRDRCKLQQNPAPTLLKEINRYVKWSQTDAGIAKNENLIPILILEMKKPNESFKGFATRVQEQIHGLGEEYREAWRVQPEAGDDADDEDDGDDADDADEEPQGKGKMKGKEKAKTPPQKSKGSSKKRKRPEVDEGEESTEPESLKATRKCQKTEPSTSAMVPASTYKRRLPIIFGITIAHSIVQFSSHDPEVPGKALRNLAIFNFGKDGQDVWNALAVAILVVWVRDSLVKIWNQMIEDGEVGDTARW
ncbi:MAG: hypothetical protein MMC33_009318 [Icmadophila ericetorum]|nr:hypothetical protein [Icmadophila ericetorum]